MITIIATILIGVLSFLLTHFLSLPWFSPMIIAFIFGLTTAKLKSHPFIMGALGVSLFWLAKIIPAYLANDGLLTERIANLFTAELGFTITPFLLVLLSILIGGLLGGLSALSGHLLLAPNNTQPNLLRKGKSTRRSGTYKLRLE